MNIGAGAGGPIAETAEVGIRQFVSRAAKGLSKVESSIRPKLRVPRHTALVVSCCVTEADLVGRAERR